MERTGTTSIDDIKTQIFALQYQREAYINEVSELKYKIRCLEESISNKEQLIKRLELKEQNG